MIASDPATDRTMPTLFVPHGAGPCFFMEWNPPTAWNAMADFLRGIAATLPAKPTAIVLISGHWLQSTFSVTSAALEITFTTDASVRRRGFFCAVTVPVAL